MLEFGQVEAILNNENSTQYKELEQVKPSFEIPRIVKARFNIPLIHVFRIFADGEIQSSPQHLHTPWHR